VADAFVQLLRDMLAGKGTPSFEWVVVHAPDGDSNGAMDRAWAACVHPFAMAGMLCLMQHAAWRPVATLVFPMDLHGDIIRRFVEVGDSRNAGNYFLSWLWDEGHDNPVLCELIRALVPTPEEP